MKLDCAAGNIRIVEAIFGRTEGSNVCSSTKKKQWNAGLQHQKQSLKVYVMENEIVV